MVTTTTDPSSVNYRASGPSGGGGGGGHIEVERLPSADMADHREGVVYLRTTDRSLWQATPRITVRATTNADLVDPHFDGEFSLPPVAPNDAEQYYYFDGVNSQTFSTSNPGGTNWRSGPPPGRTMSSYFHPDHQWLGDDILGNGGRFAGVTEALAEAVRIGYDLTLTFVYFDTTRDMVWTFDVTDTITAAAWHQVNPAGAGIAGPPGLNGVVDASAAQVFVDEAEAAQTAAEAAQVAAEAARNNAVSIESFVTRDRNDTAVFRNQAEASATEAETSATEANSASSSAEASSTSATNAENITEQLRDQAATFAVNATIAEGAAEDAQAEAEIAKAAAEAAQVAAEAAAADAADQEGHLAAIQGYIDDGTQTGATLELTDAGELNLDITGGGGTPTPVGTHLRYFGWSSDQALETTDFALANNYQVDAGEWPTTPVNAYPWFAVPESVGAPIGLRRPPNPDNQILAFTRQTGTVDDIGGEAHIVYYGNSLWTASDDARPVALDY